jgi:single stranded DNA-binding protein
MSLNTVILKGNLGSDPQLTQTQYGKPVAVMKLAVERNTKASGTGENARPDWFRLVAFDQLGERCARYLHKGSEILVEGRLVNRQYQDEQEITRTTTEIWLRNVEFLARWGERSGETEVLSSGVKGRNPHAEGQNPLSERSRKVAQILESEEQAPSSTRPVQEVGGEGEPEPEMLVWDAPRSGTTSNQSAEVEPDLPPAAA